MGALSTCRSCAGWWTPTISLDRWFSIQTTRVGPSTDTRSKFASKRSAANNVRCRIDSRERKAAAGPPSPFALGSRHPTYWIFAMCYRRPLTIKILQILILLLGSFGITCRAVASEAQPLGIGLTREASAAPLFIAVEEGYFAAEGLEPHLTFFNDDSSVSAAVASGKLDIGFAALSSSFFSFAAAHDLKMIASRSSDQSRFPMYALLMKKEAHSARLDGIRELTRRSHRRKRHWFECVLRAVQYCLEIWIGARCHKNGLFDIVWR